MFYEMLTGVVPFTGETPVDVMLKLVSEAVVPPRKRAPGIEITDEAEALIMKALSKDPRRRHQIDGGAASRSAALVRLGSLPPLAADAARGQGDHAAGTDPAAAEGEAPGEPDRDRQHAAGNDRAAAAGRIQLGHQRRRIPPGLQPPGLSRSCSRSGKSGARRCRWRSGRRLAQDGPRGRDASASKIGAACRAGSPRRSRRARRCR